MKLYPALVCYGWLVLSAPASVIITRLDSPVPMGLSDELDRAFVDFNHDGIPELLLYCTSGSIGAYYFSGNRIAIVSSPPPNIGGYVTDLPFGSLIGAAISPAISDPRIRWYGGDKSLDPYVQSETYGDRLASVILQMSDNAVVMDVYGNIIRNSSLVTSGNILGREGTLGFEFKIGQNTHYGYIHYNSKVGSGLGFNGWDGAIIGWAYEDEPGKSITAMPIPESSLFTFLGFSAFFLSMNRRRPLKR